MKKQKVKVRISAFVKREMGEWIRKTAFENRCSQGEIIRTALKDYRERLGEADFQASVEGDHHN